jgi:hypothetical protein
LKETCLISLDSFRGEGPLKLAEAPKEREPLGLVVDHRHCPGLHQIRREVDFDQWAVGVAGPLLLRQLSEDLAPAESRVLPHALGQLRTGHEHHVGPEEPYETLAIASLQLPPSFQERGIAELASPIWDEEPL